MTELSEVRDSLPDCLPSVHERFDRHPASWRPDQSIASGRPVALRICWNAIDGALSKSVENRAVSEGKRVSTATGKSGEETRSLIKLCNDRLADAVDLQLQCKHAFWNTT